MLARLTNPVTKKPAGKIVIGMGWHNPLQLPWEAADKSEYMLGVRHVACLIELHDRVQQQTPACSMGA